MRIAVNDFIEKITNENYEINQVEATKSDFNKKAHKMVEQMSSNFNELTDAGQLAQSRILLKTKSEPIIISLESGVVNLPFENVKQVDNFFDELEDETEVVVNLIVKDPDINASGLRIDQICTAAELNQGVQEYSKQITSRIQELLGTIEDNKVEEK